MTPWSERMSDLITEAYHRAGDKHGAFQDQNDVSKFWQMFQSGMLLGVRSATDPELKRQVEEHFKRCGVSLRLAKE
jgi:hypothetical protein